MQIHWLAANKSRKESDSHIKLTIDIRQHFDRYVVLSQNLYNFLQTFFLALI